MSSSRFLSDIHAAFVVAISPTGEVAITTRDRGLALGLPGGKLEPGESARDAAIREAAEEGWLVKGVCETPVFHTTVEGKTVVWYLAGSARQLPRYKEQGRISPVWADIKALLKADPDDLYGNRRALAAAGLLTPWIKKEVADEIRDLDKQNEAFGDGVSGVEFKLDGAVVQYNRANDRIRVVARDGLPRGWFTL